MVLLKNCYLCGHKSLRIKLCIYTMRCSWTFEMEYIEEFCDQMKYDHLNWSQQSLEFPKTSLQFLCQGCWSAELNEKTRDDLVCSKNSEIWMCLKSPIVHDMITSHPDRKKKIACFLLDCSIVFKNCIPVPQMFPEVLVSWYPRFFFT